MWLSDEDAFADRTQNAIQWVSTRCSGGRFGSTQATILALKAIIQYDVMRARATAPGTVSLRIDDEHVGSLPFDADTKDTLLFREFEGKLTAGAHSFELEMTGEAQMPYSASLEYYSASPVTERASRVTMSLELDKSGTMSEGAVAEVLVKIGFAEGVDAEKPLPMTVAIIGVPGGLEVRFDQLRELRTRGEVDAFEVREGNELVLYWRHLAKQKNIRIEAIAAVPGTYQGRASRVYEYYADESKYWVQDPLRVTIAPRA